MPYSIVPYQNGYKVCLTAEPTRCFSNRPLSRRTAEKQRVAIQLSEAQRGELQAGARGIRTDFQDYLESIGLPESLYLQFARDRAEKAGYDPSSLQLSDRPRYKLVLTDPTGRRRYFGATGYRDYIIYLFLEATGQVSEGEAFLRRQNYHARASKAGGEWKKDPFSPNRLALVINW